MESRQQWEIGAPQDGGESTSKKEPPGAEQGLRGDFFRQITSVISMLDAQRLDQCPRVQDEVLINSILINQLIKQDS